MNPRENEFRGKREVDGTSNNFPQITSSTSSSRHWSNSKNPRIVRVSQNYGGKDRHSKVCTVKGLRDRRIRLSVPTAVQIYDLQDRLGLNRPSKVVDWLLEATKSDIDNLPPLPMIPTHSSSSPLPHYAKYFDFTQNDEVRVENHNQDQGFGGFMAQNIFPTFTYNNLHCGPSSNYHFPNPTQDFCPNSFVTPFVPNSYIAAPSKVENDHLRQQVNNHMQLGQHSNPLLPTTLHFITSPMKSLGFNVASRRPHSPDQKT